MDGPSHSPPDISKAVPSKSILKKRDSQDPDSHHTDLTVITDDEASQRRAQWDEMNILATYHPADKDYGHMKIDDPPTPFHEYSQEMAADDEKMDATDSASGQNLRERKASFSDTTTILDAATLAEKLNQSSEPRAYQLESLDSDEDSHLTEEEKMKKDAFQTKRKHHYNEFQV